MCHVVRTFRSPELLSHLDDRRVQQLWLPVERGGTALLLLAAVGAPLVGVAGHRSCRSPLPRIGAAVGGLEPPPDDVLPDVVHVIVAQGLGQEIARASQDRPRHGRHGLGAGEDCNPCTYSSSVKLCMRIRSVQVTCTRLTDDWEAILELLEEVKAVDACPPRARDGQDEVERPLRVQPHFSQGFFRRRLGRRCTRTYILEEI